jgi:hypothetical protein
MSVPRPPAAAWLRARVIALVSIAAASACALPGGTVRMASTHHVDASHAVVPRRHVEGQAKKLCGILFVSWGVPDAEMMKAAIDDALRRDPGARLLVDAQSDASVYWVPLLFSRCRVHVSGTSATTTVRTRPGEESPDAPD